MASSRENTLTIRSVSMQAFALIIGAEYGRKKASGHRLGTPGVEAGAVPVGQMETMGSYECNKYDF